MGLDYGYAVKKGARGYKAKRADVDILRVKKQFAYWRDHADLRGWMERLYFSKGGRSSVFRHTNVCLARKDLARLEVAIRAGTLPHTKDSSFDNRHDMGTDLIFVTTARDFLDSGYDVYYAADE